MFHTYMDAFDRELAGYKTLYDFQGEMAGFISRSRPLFDALDYLDATIYGIRLAAAGNPKVETAANGTKRLGTACEILGEVLDDLEAEENSDLLPEWDKGAKQLWYGEILCREYSRVAPTQFQILDSFHVREWPRSVPTPCRSEMQLRDAIDDLNGGLMPGSPIKFEVFNMRPAWFRFRPRFESR